MGAPQCQSLTAHAVEALVARQALVALEPASLELSLQALMVVTSRSAKL